MILTIRNRSHGIPIWLNPCVCPCPVNPERSSVSTTGAKKCWRPMNRWENWTWGLWPKSTSPKSAHRFLKAISLSAAIAIGVILAGVAIFFKLTDPILKQLQTTVGQLEKALSEVRTLKGIVPICSFCKKVRNDKGYWDQVEVYVRNHTEADFSHSICPDCLAQHYPDLDLPPSKKADAPHKSNDSESDG